MRRVLWAVLVGIGVLSLDSASAHAGMVFDFLLDNNGWRNTEYVSPPIVGSGRLSFDNDLADGSYLLVTLQNLSFSVTVASETWTESDTAVFDLDTKIVIYGSGTRFSFDGAGTTTPTGGALEIFNANGEWISVEPGAPGAVHDDLYDTSTGYRGVYGVLPEPSSWCLTLTGAALGLLGTWHRRRVASGK